MTTTTLTHDETSATAEATPQTRRTRFRRWAIQAHVLLAASLMVKLIWFNSQVEVKFTSPALFVTTLGTVMLIIAPLVLLRARARVAAILMIDVVVSLLILADLVYYRYFFGLITVATLEQGGQAGAVSGSISSLLDPTDFLLLLDVLVALVILRAWGARRFLRPAGELRSRRSAELAVFALLIGSALVASPIEAQRRNGDAFDGWWDMAAYQFTGLVGFHVYDAARYSRERWFRPEISPAQEAEVQDYFSNVRTFAQRPGAPEFGEFEGANVLVVQVEALQRMVLGAEVAGGAVTPHLNALRANSMEFTNLYHQVSEGRTSDAELLTECGLHPARVGTAFFKYARNSFSCNPEVLGRAGYSTSVHHAYQGSFWNRNDMYPRMGFDQFFALKDFEQDEPLGWALGDRSFLRQTVDQLAEREQPFYGKAVTLSSHHPFDLEDMDPDLDVGELSSTQLGDYLRTIHYVDDAVGGMIARLKEKGLWDNTVLIVYGDHDSRIYDKGPLESFTGKPYDPYVLQQSLRNVPLLVHLPGDAYAGEAIFQPMGQIDLAPTLWHLLGIQSDPGTTLGVDRFTTNDSPVVFREGGFVDADRFVDLESSGGDIPCYSRQSGTLLEDGACAAEIDRAREQLKVSDLILDYDLVR